MRHFILLSLISSLFLGCAPANDKVATKSGETEAEPAAIEQPLPIVINEASIVASEEATPAVEAPEAPLSAPTTSDEDTAAAAAPVAPAPAASAPQSPPASPQVVIRPTPPTIPSISAKRLEPPPRIAVIAKVPAPTHRTERATSPSFAPDDGAQPTREISSVSSQPTPSTEDEVEEEPESEETPTVTAQRTTAEVYQAASQLRGLSGWTVIPFAHFQRGNRHAVVAWPAINSAGTVVDATVVGICLEETDDGDLEECSRRWVVRDRSASMAAMRDALGGSNYQVRGRSAGIPLDDLGPRLGSLGTEFAQAASSGNRARARQTAMAFTRMLPLDTVAYENGVAQLLWMAARHNGRLEHVSTVQDGARATLTFHARRGLIRVQTITATARRVSGDDGRWIVTSYR